MKFGRVITAACENVEPPPDARCGDPAFALANPDICPLEPQLIIKPQVAFSCVLGSTQFKAFIVENGKETDVTESTTFSSSSPDVALIGVVSGNATGIGAGVSTISASYQEKSAFASFTIIAGNSCCNNNDVALMLVVDNTRSMSAAFSGAYASKLVYAKAAAAEFCNSVNAEKDLIGAMYFNSLEEVVLSDPIADKSAVTTLINGISQSTQTTLYYDALVAAIASLNGTSSSTLVLVLISDGEDSATSYTDKNPISLLSDFKATGGIVICLGVRAHGRGYNLLEAFSTGGFFVNAYATTASDCIDFLIGLKGYLCGGNCTPTGDVIVGQGKLDYSAFINWNVVGGTVDLQGNGFFDFLPGNGLYVDMAGTTPNRTGKLVSKTPFAITANHEYRLSVDLSGNQRVDASPESVRVRLYYLSADVNQTPVYLVDQSILINDYAQPFQTYPFTFQAPVSANVYISIQQEEQPSGGDTRIGLFLSRVKFTDTTDLITLLDDDFDGENQTYVPPRCGTGTIYIPSYGYYTGTSCYGDGCLSSPPPVQLEDPNALPDIESGYTPPVTYTSTKQACATCPAGSINLSATNLVPTMTGNALPSGLAFSNDEFTPAWKAFDGDDATFWRGVALSGINLGYKFAAVTVIGAYSLLSYKGSAPGTFTFEGSNDGTTWTVLDTQTNLSWFFGGETKNFSITNSTAYLYYRINISAPDAIASPAIWTFALMATSPGQVCKTATATSEVSQADADNQAYAAALATAQALLNCATVYTGNESYTAKCGTGSLGSDVTKSATETSLVSQQDADDKALLAAKTAALAARDCTASNNQQKITINDAGTGVAPATPYPSVKYVSGLTGLTTKVTVTLKGLSHTFPDDIIAVLMAPTGETCLLMANSGGSTPVANADIVFDDAGAGKIPDAGPLVAGTYKPGTFVVYSNIPVPAPQQPHGITLAVFIGKNPNGAWSLWVGDDTPLNAGQIALGFDLTIVSA